MTAPIGAWRVLERRLAFDGSPWVRNWVETIETPSGRRVDDFHVVEMRDFAVVVAWTADGRLVTEREYRHGLGAVSRQIPSGYIETGEMPLIAAQRELREETGYGGGTWSPLGAFVVDGNHGCGTMHGFLARGVAPIAAQHLDATEQIEVVVLTRDEAVAALRAGEFGTLGAAGGLAIALLLDDSPA